MPNISALNCRGSCDTPSHVAQIFPCNPCRFCSVGGVDNVSNSIAHIFSLEQIWQQGWLPLVFITGTLTDQCFVNELLQQVAQTFLNTHSSALFHQDNARPHTVSRAYLEGPYTMPWPAACFAHYFCMCSSVNNAHISQSLIVTFSLFLNSTAIPHFLLGANNFDVGSLHKNRP